MKNRTEYNKQMVERMRQDLGMHPSTARSRLSADIIFRFVQALSIKCWRCGQEMSRDEYTVEHKLPWLGSPDARKLFFDPENISFSHLTCNVAASRKPQKKLEIDHGNYVNFVVNGRRSKCKCDVCREAWNTYKRNLYNPEVRSARYQRTGN